MDSNNLANKQTGLSRIDRAIVDNRPAIVESFGDQALLVQDFILFIMSKLTRNLFNFATFTLKDFCQATNNSRQQMSIILPEIEKGKLKAPVKSDYVFETVFDYALFSMMQKNLMFSKVYQYKEKNQDKGVSLESIRILSDISIRIGPNNRKIYEVRISPELIYAFTRRYYTVDSDKYKLLGTGRGALNRKSFFIFLCKIKHNCLSQNISEVTYPVDVLAYEASIKTEKNFHTKQNIKRLLDKIIEIGYPFKYEFVQKKVNTAHYYVKFTFYNDDSKQKILTEHYLYMMMLDKFYEYFNGKYGSTTFNDKEPFQRWLNAKVDLEFRATTIRTIYKKYYSVDLTDIQLNDIIYNGFDSFLTNDSMESEIEIFNFSPESK